MKVLFGSRKSGLSPQGSMEPEGMCEFYLYHGPPKPSVLEVFTVNEMVLGDPNRYFSCFGGSWQ